MAMLRTVIGLAEMPYPVEDDATHGLLYLRSRRSFRISSASAHSAFSSSLDGVSWGMGIGLIWLSMATMKK